MTGGIATIFTRALHGWTCQSWSGVDISNALGAEAAGITRDKWDCNHSIRGLLFLTLCKLHGRECFNLQKNGLTLLPPVVQDAGRTASSLLCIRNSSRSVCTIKKIKKLQCSVLAL